MRTCHRSTRTLAWSAMIAAVFFLLEAPLAATDKEPRSGESRVSTSDEQRKALAKEKELIRLFADTLAQVRLRYVDANVSDRELIEAAIQGMISKLDPYSVYIAPKDVARFRKGIEREYVGIGIQVSESSGPERHLMVISPLFDTPAWRAGLRAGDRILRINETSTAGLSIDGAIRLMAGDVGAELKVTVLHAGTKNPETVTLKRELIHQPTVLGYRRGRDGVWDFFCDAKNKIGYVRLIAFSRNTSKDLAAIARQLKADRVKALVLDLRFNPGGMLSEAIQVSDLFVRQGEIVSVAGRGTPRQSWSAHAAGTEFPDGFPIAVLVNRYSASAAEIVAACLQDNKVGVIVGERTWGKGSVQNIILLEDGKSALKLTTAGYQRPSGKNIHRRQNATKDDQWGVKPDKGFEVRNNETELVEFGFHLAALDELTRLDPPARERAGKEKGADKDKGADKGENRPPFVDRKLNKALEYLRGRISSKSEEPQKKEPQKKEAKKVAVGVG